MNRSLFLRTCLYCALLAILPTTLRAATLTVTNTASTGPGTLDDVLQNVNDGDTVMFAVPLPATIILTNGTEVIGEDYFALSIIGPGADKLTISGDGTNRLFLIIEDTTVTISGMTLSNGVASIDGGGGAILNGGTLTVSGCAFKNNVSKGEDGHSPGGGAGGGGGGAIFNGSVDVLDASPSALYVVNSTFSDNQAIGGGGDQAGGGSGGGFGGAIFNAYGLMIVSNCTFAANHAVGGTSGIANDNEGFGDGGNGLANEGDGFGSAGFGDGSDGGDANVGGGGGAASEGEQDSGICNGGNGGHGGMGGIGGGGGAGGRGADGCVTNAPGDGGNGGNGGDGGDGGFGGGGAGAGAGGQPTGVGTLTGTAGTPGLGGLGGGNGVSTNGGAGAGFGGAIFTYAFGGTYLFNCTITSNSVAGGSSAGHVADGQGIAGGIYNFDGFVSDFGTNIPGYVEVLNTIIAGNTADSIPDVGGTIASDGHNLIGISDGSTGFVNGTNGDLIGSAAHPLAPGLSMLASNGGPTFTCALLSSSPAINAGADVDCPATDQRGVTRPQIIHCDIGAFEFNNRPPTAICQNVTVSVVSNCSAAASINNGSFDPDPGDTVTLSQSPPSPYPVGVTTVTLTATDHQGATNSCTATVTVVNHVPPTITCPPTIATAAVTPAGAVVAFSNPPASGCSPTVRCSPDSGSTFPIGDTTVACTASDVSGNTNSCSFTVHVKNVTEQLSDTDATISGLGLDSRTAAKLHQNLHRISMQVARHHAAAACKQLLSLVLVTEHQLALGRLTDFQAVQITTPLIRMHGALGCS
ncbi:MAG TPA: choice-of-anchor Q domain-containing protein [Verrucomicrobiae bacterium]|nr:choice-of-anchor Q domain-containing protein [Verrucomicrobiae bacterium]